MSTNAGSENMDIVKADPPRVDDLLAFAKENFILTYGHLNTEENMKMYLKNAFSEGAFEQEFNHPNSTFFLVLVDEKIVGYYKMNVGDAQTESCYHQSLEIERIYVTSDLKGSGIGRQMILHSIQQARQAQLDYIWLGVWEKNPKAIRFYKKMGFEEIDTHVFQLGDDAQTDIIMKLEL